MLDHPLKVNMPLGGQFYMLNWSTHNEGSNIILARTESSVLTVFKCHLKKQSHCDLKTHSFSLIEVVAPPEYICQQAREKEYKDEVLSFLEEVTYDLAEYVKSGEAAPKIFTICNDYKCEYHAEDPENKYLPRHSDCENCKYGLKLNGISPEELYDQYNKLWKEAFFVENEYKYKQRYSLEYSRARIALEQEDVHMCGQSFGHHSHGISLSKIDYEYKAGFYYVNLRQLSLDPFKTLIEEHKKDVVIKENQTKLILENKKINDKKKKISGIKLVFKESK